VANVTRSLSVRRADCTAFEIGDRVESSIKPEPTWHGTIIGYYDMHGDAWHGYYAVRWDGDDEDEPHDDSELSKVSTQP
jgi:hypothetical protein